MTDRTRSRFMRAGLLLIPLVWVLAALISSARGGMMIENGRARPMPWSEIFSGQLYDLFWWMLIGPVAILALRKTAGSQLSATVRGLIYALVGLVSVLAFWLFRVFIHLPGDHFVLRFDLRSLGSTVPTSASMYLLIVFGALTTFALAQAREREDDHRTGEQEPGGDPVGSRVGDDFGRGARGVGAAAIGVLRTARSGSSHARTVYAGRAPSTRAANARVAIASLFGAGSARSATRCRRGPRTSRRTRGRTSSSAGASAATARPRRWIRGSRAPGRGSAPGSRPRHRPSGGSAGRSRSIRPRPRTGSGDGAGSRATASCHR